MNKKTKEATKTIMKKLADLNLNNGEAINALTLALIISAQGVALDKINVVENLSQNWDILSDTKTLTH